MRSTMLVSADYRFMQPHQAVIALLAADGGASVANSALIDLGEHLVLWDSGMTPQAAAELRRAATVCAGRAPDLLINSHYHYDHIWGNQLFADRPIISSRRTRDLILSNGRAELDWTRDHQQQELADWRARTPNDPVELQQQANYIAYCEAIAAALPTLKLIAPTITFEQKLTLYGTQRQAELISFDTVHSPSDTVLYLPEEQLVCCGDILAVGCHPYMAEGNIQHVLQTLDTLVGWGATTFIPGHGAVGSVADVDRLRGYCEHLLDRAARGDAESAMPAQYRGWALPDFYALNVRAVLGL